MIRIRFIALGVLLSAMITACAAKPHVESGSIVMENENIKGAMIFSARDREKIIHYFIDGKKNKTLPPGLAKKQELPPGLQKQIKKYGELPPGLEGRRLPDSLERTLNRLPEGYVRIKIEGDVVLMNEKTRVVFDVVWNVD
jgi:hypothetical protein